MSFPSSKTTKVMLVDDSVVVRGMLRQIIEEEADMEVVTTAINGKVALAQYKTHTPDIVILDIEMPEMNGIQCLTEILKINPKACVIMCSSLTQKGTDLSIQALNLGAFECLAKPTTTSIDRGTGFKTDLIRLIKNIKKQPMININHQKTEKEREKFKLSTFDLAPFPTSFYGSVPQALAIGSSTGGPKALGEVIANLKEPLDIPVFITQHMPKGFTKLLADSLSKDTNHTVIEAEDDMRVKRGVIYIAPGGKHMTIERRTAGIVIVLTDDEPVQYCKPSVDVMLESIMNVYNTGIIVAILTGMGEDGLNASTKISQNSIKNIIIAQDETTSIVWGMPGAVAMSGIAHAVIPMSNIAPALNKLMNGQKP